MSRRCVRNARALPARQLCVISSGLTDGFETYDFDVFTSWVRISGRFRGVMEPISVAEVREKIRLPRGLVRGVWVLMACGRFCVVFWYAPIDRVNMVFVVCDGFTVYCGRICLMWRARKQKNRRILIL